MLSLFLLGGANSVKAEKLYSNLSKLTNGPESKWDGTTNTMTWIGYSNNMISEFDFPTGDLSSWTSVTVDVTSLNNGDGIRIQMKADNVESDAIKLTGAGTHTTLLSAFKKGEVQMDLRNVQWIRILGSYYGDSHTIAPATPASAKISKVYLEEKNSLSFNNSCIANLDLTKLKVSEGVTYDPATGILTSTSTDENLYYEFENEDFSKVTNINVTRVTSGTEDEITYSDIIDKLDVYDASTSNSLHTWISSKYGVSDFASYSPNRVNKINWHINAIGTMKFTGVSIKGNTMVGCAPGWFDVSPAMYNNTSAVLHLNQDAACVYGKENGFTGSDYADISGCKKLKLTGTKGTTVRIYINSAEAKSYTLDSDGNLIIDFETDDNYKDADHLYLVNIRSSSYQTTANISSVQLYTENYSLFGSGRIISSAQSILDNENMTSINAKGVTSASALSTVNPNCLITANSGKVTNSNNVIVDGVCTSLELSDGNYPFSAPETFTATSVSFNRTFKAGTRSTVCLPFDLTAAEAAEAGTFYELSGTENEGTQLTFEDITASGTTAYKPYIFEAKVDGTPFTGYSSKEIAETPATFTGTTVEGYTLTGVLTGSSDVAADHPGKKVYGWSANSGKEGTFVKVGAGVAIDPFRAYVVYDGSGSSPARMAARFVGGSITGINEVSETPNVLNPDRKYIENNKIVIVKNGVKFNAAGQQVK